MPQQLTAGALAQRRRRAQLRAGTYAPRPPATAAEAATRFRKGQSGNPLGREKRSVPVTELATITALAARGVREQDIGRAVGMSQQVWARQRDAQPEVMEALNAGRQQMHDKLVGKLYAKAMSGDTVSLLFLLKSRFGYREGESAEGARPQVIINLPAAMPTLEQYRAAPALVPVALQGSVTNVQSDEDA